MDEIQSTMTLFQSNQTRRTRLGRWLVACGVMTTLTTGLLIASGDDSNQIQLQTDTAAFFGPGTQPNTDYLEFKPLLSSTNCVYCHSDFNADTAPYDTWVVSLMGQSARDPVWHAALSIANQDATNGGESCIRCHAPRGWLNGKSEDGLIDDFDGDDYDGINCHFCHRAVNPVYGPDSGVGYPEGGLLDPDLPILQALEAEGNTTNYVGNNTMVIDPEDHRRGPYSDVPEGFHGIHGTDGYGNFVHLITSPYHKQSSFCGECHDVSNPLYEYDAKSGKHELTDLTQPHPTSNPMHMYPEQRTYSEWLVSDFASGGVVFEDDRFGGAHPTGIMESCQDCHMPKQVGAGCVFLDYEEAYRPDIGQHSFAGANTWVIDAIRTQQGDDAANMGLTEERVLSAKSRNIQMLKDASDMELTVDAANKLNVRIINQTGHKLPTGYPEGRRIWINVKFFDENDDEILTSESGRYNEAGAFLEDTENTKIYEMKAGLDSDLAALTNLPAGESFHLALNNTTIFDNRIPPRGATNAELEAVRAEPVGYTYVDGQYWDDTKYDIPPTAKSAVAKLFYQTTTREYIEFLEANSQDGTGAIAKQLWDDHGKSAPVEMDAQMIELVVNRPGDINGDGIIDGIDLAFVLSAWGSSNRKADINGDGLVNGMDLSIILSGWGL